MERPELVAKALVSVRACEAETPGLSLVKFCTGLGGTETCERGVAARMREGVNSADVAIIFEGALGIISSRIAGEGCPCVASKPGGTDGVDGREPKPKLSWLCDG